MHKIVNILGVLKEKTAQEGFCNENAYEILIKERHQLICSVTVYGNRRTV